MLTASRDKPHRKALVMMNGGLGNGLILAPLLAALEAERPEWAYYTAPNAILDAAWVREPLGLRGGVGGFPTLWRRFAPSDRDSVWRFMEDAGADLVINLRKELARDDGNYFDFKAQSALLGIECWDLHELEGEERRRPIGEQAALVLRRHGLDVVLGHPAWLSRRRTPRPQVVGLYTGASTQVKRWSVENWVSLAAQLRGEGWTIEAGAGSDREERTAAMTIGASVPTIPVVTQDSLEAMRDWIASLDLLISNDTLSVHVAAALGCPVIALYLATYGAIWAPRAAPGRLAIVQSVLALCCMLMKDDGTCARYYRGCSAPCHRGVSVSEVVRAIDIVGAEPA